MKKDQITRDRQYYKFCFYGFLKNLRFFEPFLIIFFLQKGFSYLEIGTLYAIREVALNIFEIPSGIIADTLGRKWTLASTFLVYIISFLIFSFAEGYLLLSMAMTIYALADAARSGVNKALIIRYLEKTGQAQLKVDYYGHTRSYSQFGSALSSLLAATLVVFHGNLEGIFLFSIIPYLIDFLLVSSYPADLDDHLRPAAPISEKLKELYASFKEAFRNSVLLSALTSTALYAGMYKSMKDFLQPFLKISLAAIPVMMFLENDKKLAVLIGVTYFLLFIMSAFSSRKAGKFKHWLGSQRQVLNSTLIVGAVLGIIAGLMMHTVLLPLLVVPLYIVLLVIENIRKPSAVGEITESTKTVAHASVLSILSQATSLVAAIFVLLIGWLADTYSLGIGITAVSILLLLTLPFSLVRKTGQEI